jgi:hypothetical protein
MKRLRATLDVEEPEQKGFGTKCSCGGCPLDGSISHGGGDGAQYYCYIHFNSDYNGLITANIVERQSLIQMARRGLNMDLHTWKTMKVKLVGWLTHHRMEKYFPQAKDTPYQWGERMLQGLRLECLNVVPTKPIADSWRDEF